LNIRKQQTQEAPAVSPSVFARQEKKYLLGTDARERLLFLCGDALSMDNRGQTHITNIYLDTPERLLIRRSIEKPDFKEKFRIRIYGNALDGSGSALDGSYPVFLEVKKKYLGTVYKRRVRMTLREACRFVEDGVVPLSPYRGDDAKVALNRQILREMQWAQTCYGALVPAVRVDYERAAYTYQMEGSSLRLTLDCDLSFREGTGTWESVLGGGRVSDKERSLVSPATAPVPLSLSGASGARPLLPPATCLMEIKTSAPLPLALSRALDDLGLYPRAFSKVGRAYEAIMADAQGDAYDAFEAKDNVYEAIIAEAQDKASQAMAVAAQSDEKAVRTQ
jgi:hypothetical protein